MSIELQERKEVIVSSDDPIVGSVHAIDCVDPIEEDSGCIKTEVAIKSIEVPERGPNALLWNCQCHFGLLCRSCHSTGAIVSIESILLHRRRRDELKWLSIKSILTSTT